MIELVAVGVVAGLIAGISPCVLPVLPIILVAGATTPVDSSTRWWRRRRPPAVVAGLVVSFSLVILAGTELLSLLHLPQDALRYAGIVILAAVGLGFLVPPLGSLVDRPFARIRARTPSGGAGGFLLGLGLGLVYVPCAGPVLAAVTVLGATHRVGLTAVLVTLAFAVGTAVPLLIVAVAGERLVQRVRALRRRAPRLRQAGGAVLVVMAVLIATNAFDGLQRDLPGYTTALQDRVEGSASLRHTLGSLTGTASVPLAKCNPQATALVDCGPAPDFTHVTAWLNTPGGRPLTIAGLRGKVVLVDFWTYSCINCQRTLPHVEAWYARYASDGLVVVGVHTPEFPFEHVVSNVQAAAAQLGVRYPVAVDDAYGTWDAYDNEYWPAEYLIDAEGRVRHVDFGEGGYALTESLIRQLLVDARPGLRLPPATDVPNRTPTEPTNPETYLGYERAQYDDGELTSGREAAYDFPPSLPLGAFALSGEWTDEAEEVTADRDAELELAYQADDVYLVISGTGTLGVSVGDGPVRDLRVDGIPRLYTLVHGSSTTSGTLLLRASPGLELYDFTFG